MRNPFEGSLDVLEKPQEV